MGFTAYSFGRNITETCPEGPILLSVVSISTLTTVQKFKGFVYQTFEEKQKLSEML
jgi:hypothetical protein